MTKILSSIACNFDANILLAAIPLFEAEKVQAMEWSFDALFQIKEIPPWFTELLHEFDREGRLIGHGVFFSLFSGKWLSEQQDWLEQLEKLSESFRFDHITEHFGFMTGADFHAGAPMSLPFTPTTLAIGRDRLARIQEACKCPVGIENLAFSYSLDEVKKHGDFLAQLVEPVNGFIILDLHNLYCQLHNFGIDFDDLIRLYPLERVREIHVSGGSWEDSPLRPEKAIRRDTHDDAVPKEVFHLLERVIPLCLNLKYVVLEQIGNGLATEANRRLFQQDFSTLDAIVHKHNSLLTAPEATRNSFLLQHHFYLDRPAEDDMLHAQQMQLSTILETATDYQEVKRLLLQSDLANTAWEVEKWEPCMVETALRIAQKWKRRK